jgi:hypothetical protein
VGVEGGIMTEIRPKMLGDEVEFYLPEIKRIIPVKCHPQYARAEELNTRYIRSELRGLYRDEAECQRNLTDLHALWACLVNPNAKDERIVKSAYWTSCWFTYDDIMSDADWLGAMPAQAQEVIDDVLPALNGDDDGTGKKYRKAARDNILMMQPDMTPRQMKRYLRDLREYIDAFTDEVAMRARGEIPDWKTYLDMHVTSGCEANLTVLEYGQGFDLTEELETSKELREARRLVGESYVVVNDLFSFRKEYFQGDYGNAISVFMLNEGLKLQEAVEKVCELIEEVERKFIEKREEILGSPIGARPDVRAHLSELGYAIAGNLEWSYRTPRYNGAGHVWNGVRSGKVTITPERTIYHG